MKHWWIVAMVCLGIAGCSEPGASSDAAGAEAAPGEEIYLRYCYSCHGAGVAGAPRTGRAEDWKPRLARGRDALLESTIQGVPPGMPPRGLCNQCSDEELRAALDHMVDRSLE